MKTLLLGSQVRSETLLIQSCEEPWIESLWRYLFLSLISRRSLGHSWYWFQHLIFGQSTRGQMMIFSSLFIFFIIFFQEAINLHISHFFRSFLHHSLEKFLIWHIASMSHYSTWNICLFIHSRTLYVTRHHPYLGCPFTSQHILQIYQIALIHK